MFSTVPRPSGHSIVFRLLDRTIRVSTDERDDLDHFETFYDFSGADRPSSDDASAHLKVHYQRGRGFETDPKDSFASVFVPENPGIADLVSALTQWAASVTTAYAVFHSGAVSRDNRCLLLPARSRYGKSTLTAWLVRNGFGLLSDELAAVDLVSRDVVSFPRRLSLRSDVLEKLGITDDRPGPGSVRFLSPAEIGGVRGRARCRPALICFPQYEEGSKTRLTRVDTGAVLRRLMESACSPSRLEERGLDLTLGLVRVPAYRLVYGHTDEAVGRLQNLFRETPDET